MNLKNHLFFMVVVFLLFQSFVSFASPSQDTSIIGYLGKLASGSASVSNVSNGNQLYDTSSWLVYVIYILLGMVSIILIAYLLGKTLSLPYLIGWSKEEAIQIFASLLIFIVFAVLYYFTNTSFLPDNIYGEFGLDVPSNQPAVMFYANKYLNSTLNVAKSTVKSIATTASAEGLQSNARAGVRLIPFIDPFPGLQAAYSMPVNGEAVVRVDISRVIMNSAVGVLSGLMAQKIFLNIVCGKLGPFMVILGILLRSFFATRKLGGLLLAAGIGLVLIFPLTYTLNWITYTFTQNQMTVKPKGGEVCPDACKELPDMYYTSLNPGYITSFKSKSNVIHTLERQSVFPADKEEASKMKIKILNELDNLSRHDNNISYRSITIERHDGSKPIIIYSCASPILKSGEKVDGKTIGMCPRDCRVDPYPINNQVCNNATIRKACARVPKVCIKYMNFTRESIISSKKLTSEQITDFTYNNIDHCPDTCKIIPPLKTDCNDTCLSLKSHCRIVYNNKDHTPFSSDDDCKFVANQCAINSTDPSQNCVYIVPSDPGDCSNCTIVDSYAKYNPPVYTECERLCNLKDMPSIHTSGNLFNGAPSTFGAGNNDELSVAVLMLPAYILPLFGIGVTLMFIRTFSGILGGDMEIPGMEKVL